MVNTIAKSTKASQCKENKQETHGLWRAAGIWIKMSGEFGKFLGS